MTREAGATPESWLAWHGLIRGLVALDFWAWDSHRKIGLDFAAGAHAVKIKSFTDLTVWQKAHELSLLTYKLTAGFPKAERFGIVSQLRRASASVPANIAQGYGRRTTRELLRSLQIAAGEVEEVRYFLILSRDLGYVTAESFDAGRKLCDSVAQLVSALGRSLKQRQL